VVADTIRLAVTTDEDHVTAIHLRSRATRPARGAFERLVDRELREYFAGRRRAFTFPIRPHGSPFQQRVWQALRRIPFGATRTYGEVAGEIGQPRAARAVGMANHRNPIPVVIPCHRVVAAGGKLGGYGGGLALKQRLLALEAAGR